MPRQNDSFTQLLIQLPWWISAFLGAFAFAALHWGFPLWAGQDHSRQMLAKAFVPMAPLALLMFGILAICSFFFGRKCQRLVDRQTSLETLRATSWKDFEFLVAEAYRRKGYRVDYSLDRGADGGVDLTLHKDRHTSLVQCKQWKVFSVGAPVIREMFGLMTAEKADEAVIVTTGKFTRDAQVFAAGKPIRLVDGPQLLDLVRSVQGTPASSETEGVLISAESATPTCPQCGKPMVQRTARRGRNVGCQFWGCTAYPACKGTRE